MIRGLSILSSFAVLALLCGCLSVIRVPLSHGERYSDDGVCTNRTWTVPVYDMRRDLLPYPTVKMRCAVSAAWAGPIPPDASGEVLYRARMFKRWGWIPLAVIWVTAPVDAVVDTVFLPYDLRRKSDCEDRAGVRRKIGGVR